MRLIIAIIALSIQSCEYNIPKDDLLVNDKDSIGAISVNKDTVESQYTFVIEI